MESLETRLDDLADELTLAGDWTDRYRMLVEWGDALELLPAAECTAADEVPGCSSPLWLRVRRVDGALEVRGSSPGLLPRALVAVVVRLFDGLTEAPAESLPVMDRLGLNRNLSPTRGLVFQKMVDRALSVLKGPQ